MKTRVISTDIWDEDKVFSMNIDTKLLYLVLLTNPYIGQTRFYKINDRQLSTFSGLNVEQIQKCKRDLEEYGMVFFKDGWVCVTGYGFVECFYKGARNQIAKNKEIERIPNDVYKYFTDKLDTLSIPYQYPSDTTINTKSEILNKELKTKNTKKYDVLGAEIIKALEEIDPKNKTYYNNKTQRESCDFLLKTYGLEKVLGVIKILPTTNKLDYVPVVTTPYELKEKWTKLATALQKIKNNQPLIL